MISHLIAVFIGAAFVGVPIGIIVMALLGAGRERDKEEELAWTKETLVALAMINQPTILRPSAEPEGIDWSRIGV